MTPSTDTQERGGPSAKGARPRVSRGAVLVSAGLVTACLAAVLALVDMVTRDPAVTSRAPARVAGLERDPLEEFDQVNVSVGSFERRTTRGAARGSGYAQAEVRPPFTGVARGTWEVSWKSGDTVCYGASFRFPTGFFTAAESLDVMRWDNFVDDAAHPDQGGVAVLGNGRLRVFAEQASRPGTYKVLAESRPLSTGRWVRVVVQQHLSDGRSASTSLFVDGVLEGSSPLPNSFGRPVRMLRLGLVAMYGPREVDVIRLDVDEAFFAARTCGTQDR